MPATIERALKVVVTGGFGVGKTTLIGTVSEIRPLRTEETITQASIGVDDLSGLENKTQTTVAMDFGRICVSQRTVLYIFGAPGQRRFWHLWSGLTEGAIGILVLVDTRRLEDSFGVLDQLELAHNRQPFVIAVNRFPDTPHHSLEEIRDALDLEPRVPIVECDAREMGSAVQSLIDVAEYALRLQEGV
ncbi:ATP-binding protein [Streptomyces rimosus subsp. rimosus]|nr:ATP-binding protein [Streptomyces rimosus subsp. rimosus]